MSGRTIAPDTIACDHCGRTLHPWRDAEPGEEAICGDCAERREDCARDAAFEARGDAWRDGDRDA